MKLLKIAGIAILFPIIVAATSHKFYVSTTNIEYVDDKQTVQIITKIFLDDIEEVLRERYHSEVHLASEKETEQDAKLLKEYILQKLKVTVDGKEAKFNYLGKEYDIDIVKSFIEIENVASFNSVEIENKILMDLFPEQKNIIHIKTKNTKRSLILEKENPKGVLNFN